MIEQLTELKQKLSPIADLISDKKDVFYFDYPLHLNVGDLLIYHGTEQFFKDYHIDVRLRRSEYDFDLDEVKAKITPNTTILCHGGGNFGDLYFAHQNMRETLVKTFPNNRIIVLPQTLYYKDPAKQQAAAELFAAHPDCYLLARDERTLAAFQQFSPNARLSPDMAHELYGTLPSKGQPTGQTLYFLRKDIEASDVEKNQIAQLDANAHIKDWDDILSATDSKVLAISWRVARLANKLKLHWLKDAVHAFWFNYTQKIVQRVAQTFLSYDRVVTSRLHGHIFSCLLELPNRVLDNSYGKNSSYAKLWTKELPFVEL